MRTQDLYSTLKTGFRLLSQPAICRGIVIAAAGLQLVGLAACASKDYDGLAECALLMASALLVVIALISPSIWSGLSRIAVAVSPVPIVLLAVLLTVTTIGILQEGVAFLSIARLSALVAVPLALSFLFLGILGPQLLAALTLRAVWNTRRRILSRRS